MPRLSIAKEFLARYSRLEKPVQKAVDAALGKFEAHTHAGLHLEKLEGARDPNIRTIKITNFWRGVVLAPQHGDEYHLITVLPHDEANRYATSRRFTVNQSLGVLEVRNQGALDDFAPALHAAANGSEKRLFSHVKDSDLARLGVDAQVLPLVRLLGSEAHLTALENLLPESQYDALCGLAAGMTPDEVWDDLCNRLLAHDVPDQIDPDDLASAAERTPDRYALVSGPAELTRILAHPFALWRTFLHPRQEHIARHPSYRGPVLVSGGAGTGKTVTAVHRAAYLAQRLPSGTGADILLTTYTNNLADSLAQQARLLLDTDQLRARLDVVTVNKLAYRILAESEGRPPEIVGQHMNDQLWRKAAQSTGDAFSPAFLQREWEQVVLAQDIADRDSYLACHRTGRGRGISQAKKEQVWDGIAYVLRELRATGQRTHLQVVADAARILAEQARPRYRHVLVDEGQDLHPAQWRLLRRAVAAGPDDLFIVSDPNQRIYDNRVSLGSLGINVRGRSRRLILSYRTTQEILSWSVRVLDSTPATGLDDEPDTLAGYRSQIHGRRPVVRSFPDWRTELNGLVGQVREWLAAGVEAHSIGIATRTNSRVKEIRTALEHADIMTSVSNTTQAVRVGTMHGMKGLEFRCVAVVAVEEGMVPPPAVITSSDDDPAAHRHDTQRERCLLFVACTRARDMLYVSHGRTPSQFLPG